MDRTWYFVVLFLDEENEKMIGGKEYQKSMEVVNQQKTIILILL